MYILSCGQLACEALRAACLLQSRPGPVPKPCQPCLHNQFCLHGGLHVHSFTAACVLYSSKLKAMQVLLLQADIAALQRQLEPYPLRPRQVHANAGATPLLPTAGGDCCPAAEAGGWRQHAAQGRAGLTGPASAVGRADHPAQQGTPGVPLMCSSVSMLSMQQSAPDGAGRLHICTPVLPDAHSSASTAAGILMQ